MLIAQSSSKPGSLGAGVESGAGAGTGAGTGAEARAGTGAGAGAGAAAGGGDEEEGEGDGDEGRWGRKKATMTMMTTMSCLEHSGGGGWNESLLTLLSAPGLYTASTRFRVAFPSEYSPKVYQSTEPKRQETIY